MRRGSSRTCSSPRRRCTCRGSSPRSARRTGASRATERTRSAAKKRRITLECPNGHIHEKTVADADQKFQCPECGQSATVTKDEDLIDDFFNRADAYNTRLQLISGDSEEGDMLLKAFGGVAALLRYRPN